MNKLGKRQLKKVRKKQLLYAFIDFIVLITVLLSCWTAVHCTTKATVYDSAERAINSAMDYLRDSEMVTSVDSENHPNAYVIYYDAEGVMIPKKGFNQQLRAGFTELGTIGEYYTKNYKGIRYRVRTETRVDGNYIKVISNMENAMLTAETVDEYLKYITLGLACAIIAVSALLSYSQVYPYRKKLLITMDNTRNMSHELGTHLGIVKGNLQSLNSTESALSEELTDDMLVHIDSIERLNREILTIISAETDTLETNSTQCDIRAVTEEIGELYSLLAEENNKHFICNITTDKETVCLDIKYYKKILIELLDNAMQNSAGGDTISLNVGVAKRKMTLTVTNTGEVVQTSALERFFDPFYRSDKNRSVDSSGIGLGLSLIKVLVVAMDGHITLSVNKPSGITFKVELPIN